MANLLDWFKKRTEDVFGGIGNAINQAIGATGNQAQGVANNIRNVVATQPRNIQQASQNVFRGINNQYNRTALAQTPDILADTLKNIQEITRPLNDMGKDMVAKQYGIDRNQLEQIIKQPLGDRAKFAVNRPLELNKQNPMMGIMGSPLNPTNAAFNAYNNSPVPIPKVDTTDLVNDASDLYVKSGLADPVTGWIGENIVKPTAMNVARYADVTQGQQKYSEGLKGLAEGGTDAFGIASLLYTPAKAGQLALGGKAALRVAPSAALRGAGAGAGISTLNQYADTGRINPTDVALSGLLGGVANVALPVAGGYAGRGLQRAGTAVKPVARELRLDTGGFAKLPGKNNPIDPLEALKAEARKYKSAEEFVKAQGEPIYHRSPNKFNEFDISRVSNDSNRQRYGWGLNFSDTVPHNQYGDNLYEARISKDALIDLQNPVKEDVVSRIVDAVKKNGKNPSELNEFSYNGYLFYKTLSRILGGDKDASLFLSKNGIDGLTHSIGKNANDYVLFNNASIKTKQQLTDLYNQATKGKDIDPLLNEARQATGARSDYSPENLQANRQIRAKNASSITYADKKAIKPDELVTVYRAVPGKAKGGLTEGDWVTPNKEQARLFMKQSWAQDDTGAKIVTKKVKASELRYHADDAKGYVDDELLYVPKSDPLEALKQEARKYKSAEEFVQKNPEVAKQLNTEYQNRLNQSREVSKNFVKSLDQARKQLDSPSDPYYFSIDGGKKATITRIQDLRRYGGDIMVDIQIRNGQKTGNRRLFNDEVFQLVPHGRVRQTKSPTGMVDNYVQDPNMEKLFRNIPDELKSGTIYPGTLENNARLNKLVLERQLDENINQIKRGQVSELPSKRTNRGLDSDFRPDIPTSTRSLDSSVPNRMGNQEPSNVTDLYNQANAPVGKYKTVHQGGKSVQVDGEPIKIADGLDTFIHKDENGNWVVSEATTGRSLTGGGYENKTFAIKAARDVVMTNGVDNVKKRVAEVAPQVGKTDPLEALKAEARKYKSADEFVKNNFVAHGTNREISGNLQPTNGWYGKAVYTTDDLANASGRNGGGVTYFVNKPQGKLLEINAHGSKGGSDFTPQQYQDAIKNGYDGLKIKHDNGKTWYAMFNEQTPHTKQQLTDLYKQATAPQVGKNVNGEVPKYVKQPNLVGKLSPEDAIIQSGLDSGWGGLLKSGQTDITKLTPNERAYLTKSATSYMGAGDPVLIERANAYVKKTGETALTPPKPTAPQVGKTNASGNFSKGEKVGFAGILSPQGKERTGTFVRQVDKYLAEIDYGDHTELNHVNNLYKLDDSTPPAQVGKTGGNLPPKTPPTKPGTPELPNVPKKSPKTTEVKLNTDRLDLSKTQKARVDKNTAATVKRMSNAEVEKLAKSAGIDTKQKGFNETRKEIAEQLNTRRKAVQLEKQADRARRSGDTEKAKALLKKAATLEKTSRTQGTAAGRNLQARKIIANELNSPQQKVFKLLDEAGVDVDKYVDRFADVDFSNSTQVAKAYRELVPASAEEWLDKYRYTNMLSSPLTHLVNISSNLTGTLGVSPIRKIYEGGVDATRNAVTRSGRTRYAGEGAVQFKESLKNIPAAVKEFKDVWTGKVDMTNPDFENTAITSRLAVGGKKGAIDSVLSFIPRLLEASDRFSMNMTEAGELGSLKYRQGKGIKVTDMAGKAKENATYTAFRQELNKNGQGHILGAIDWVPTILKQGREAKNPIIRNASKIAFPFVNTPTNLFKQGIEYSPLGVTTLWGNSNKTAQSAKMLMGTTATALIGGTLAANDALTFAEPSNAKERDAFRAEGKQAYSFKIGDKWISYSKMHPAIAFNFAITAAVKDAMDKGTIDQSASDKIMSAAGGMMGYLTDQSYMKNIGDLVSVFQSKDGSSIGDSISSEGMNTINQLVPFRSMVSWIGRQIDPTQRKVDYSANVMEQIYQGIVKDIPGLNSGVPTRKNPYTGQDIKSDFPLLNSWNPYRVTQDMGYGNTTGMNVEQRQMQKGLPETERAGFRAGVMQQKGLERLADKEKEQLKSAEGQTKTLSNGKVYAKVGDKYETFDSQEKADVAIFKDEFKKSDKKSAVKGDTYFYKKKNGDVVTKPKALYDWEQTDARANLEMDRAYEAKDIDTWAKAAQTKLDGLEKKKSLYDPETEQDEIDKITLQQENLLQKAAKYLSKGMGGSGGSGSRGGSRGGSGGSGGSGSFITTGFKTAAQLKAPKIKGISVRKPTYKASTKKLSVSKMPKVTGVRLT